MYKISISVIVLLLNDFNYYNQSHKLFIELI